MYTDVFEKLESQEVEKLLTLFNPLLRDSVFDPAETTIMAQKLSFYPGLRYLDIADYASVPPIHRFAIEGKNHAIVLDWSNEPIYALNNDIPIKLNADTVCDYIRFFFNHVRGKNGRFLITESIDDIRWREDPPPAARKSIGKLLVHLNVDEEKPDGGFVVPATVMFKDSLFKCVINVDASGLINLNNEELLVEDMPVLDDAFGQ